MNGLIWIVDVGWLERLQVVLVVLGLLILAGLNFIAGMAIAFENIIGTPKEVKIICNIFALGEAGLAALAYIVWGGG